MLPIAVLPIAGLLLRLGQPDLLDIAFVAAAGDAIFANLGLLFAIGVAVGLARENHGAAGPCRRGRLSGRRRGRQDACSRVPPDVAAAFADQAAQDLAAAAWRTTELAKLSVPAGILSGPDRGLALQSLSRTSSCPTISPSSAAAASCRSPPGLAGFGRRGAVRPRLSLARAGIDALSRGWSAPAPIGLFVYGVLNRLLIVTGLHHILNNIAWFIVGDYHGTTGDLNRFFAGDPTAGELHGGLLPGDDVRPARRLPRHVSLRRARAAQGGRRHAAVAGADLAS